MTYYVSAKSYAAQKEDLVGVTVVIIGGDLKIIEGRKQTDTRKTSSKQRGKNPLKQ